MFRRLAAACLLGGALLIASVGIVSAAAPYGNCAGNNSNYWAGSTSAPLSSYGTVTQIRATIDTDSGFHLCTNRSAFTWSSSTGWIGIGGNLNANSIIQIGIGMCGVPAGYSYWCGDQFSSPRFWWSYGGCNNGGSGDNHMRDLGAADSNPHNYRIAYNPAWTKAYHLYIDDVVVANVDDGDAGISCWINGQYTKWGEWLGERHDSKDGLGNAYWGMSYTGMQLVINGVWVNVLANCSFTGQAQSYCIQSGGNFHGLYTLM